MARIIKKGADLEKQLADCQKRSRNGFRYALLFFVIGIVGLLPLAFFDKIIIVTLSVCWACLFMLIAIVFVIRTTPSYSEMNILSAGVEGERAAVRCVQLLPDSYTVFRNLTVEYDGKSSEIDLVIVGPTGVFVVETKNLNGSISGGANDAQWIQYKVGRGGTPYSKRFYNPMKQVNTHVYRLANHLRDNGIWAYVNAAVYFVNIETDINIDGTDGKTELFSARRDGANKLLHYVVNNNQRLTQTECEKIISLLKRL